MAFYDPEKEGSDVFIYALSTCAHCRAAKKLLTELGVAFDHVDVDTLPEERMQEALSEMIQYNPGQTFPTLIIGTRVIVGNREDDIRQAVEKIKGSK